MNKKQTKTKKVAVKKEVTKTYFFSKYGVVAHSESEAKRLSEMRKKPNK